MNITSLSTMIFAKEIEELIQHLEMWYAEDDYDAYNRFFGLREARIMGMIIYQLTNNWNELEEYLKGLIDNFKEDVSTSILHEQLVIEMIYEYMKEIKEGKNE